eukprot:6482140-Amphidinium_carterae.1
MLSTVDRPKKELPAEPSKEDSNNCERAPILSTMWEWGWKSPLEMAKPSHRHEDLTAMPRARCPAGNTSLILRCTRKGLRRPNGSMTHLARLSSNESSSRNRLNASSHCNSMSTCCNKTVPSSRNRTK